MRQRDHVKNAHVFSSESQNRRRRFLTCDLAGFWSLAEMPMAARSQCDKSTSSRTLTFDHIGEGNIHFVAFGKAAKQRCFPPATKRVGASNETKLATLTSSFLRATQSCERGIRAGLATLGPAQKRDKTRAA